MQQYNHKIKYVNGPFTEESRMVCIPKPLKSEVILCLSGKFGGFNIPISKIVLHSATEDAPHTFEDAKALGIEIAKRWNANTTHP